MKKYIAASSLVFLFSISALGAANEWNGNYTNNVNNVPTFFSYPGAFGDFNSDVQFATDLRTMSNFNNVGFLEVRNHEDTTITVDRLVEGYINIDFNNNYGSGIDVTINGYDDFFETGIIGRDADNNNAGNREINAQDALFIDESKNHANYTFNEGMFWGGDHQNSDSGKDGGDFTDMNTLKIYGTMFIGGNAGATAIEQNGDQALTAFGGDGLNVADTLSVVISNSATYDFYRGGNGGRILMANNNNRTAEVYGGPAFEYNGGGEPTPASLRELMMYNAELYGGDGGTVTWNNGRTIDTEAYAYGGDAFIATNVNARVYGGYFWGGDGGSAETEGDSTIVDSHGGNGIQVGHNLARRLVAFTNVYTQGGDGGEATTPGRQAMVDASGGRGLKLVGTAANVNIQSVNNQYSRFYGGAGGTASGGSFGGKADAGGGSGIELRNAETVTVRDNDTVPNYWVQSFGGNGGAATGDELADGSGGDGIRAVASTVIVEDGYYQGGNGGTAGAANGLANGSGGNGLMALDSTITISNGVFMGGLAGGASAGGTALNYEGVSVYAIDSILEISGGLFYDGVTLNAASKDAGTAINGGTIDGLTFRGPQTHDVALNGGTISGGIVQEEGTVNINSWADAYVQNVLIQRGMMNFNGAAFMLNSGGRVMLESGDSAVAFNQGATIGANSLLSIGSGHVDVDGDFDLLSGGMLYYVYDEASATAGSMTIENGRMTAPADSTIAVAGRVVTRTNTLILATAEAGVGNVDEDAVVMNMGWLTQYVVDNAGIDLDVLITDIALAETALTNEVPLQVLDTLDATMTDATFATLNEAGYKDTLGSLKVSYSQIPDTLNTVFNGNRQLNKLLAARGTDFRSGAGLASTVPKFKKYSAPTGPAGPLNESGDLKAWLRGYGQIGERDEEDGFDMYDISTLGTAIGIDKSFGNALIGIAGGLAAADLQGVGYDADITTYHGSLYSTIGGDETFVDLALTYGYSTTEGKTLLLENQYNSDLFSGYIGGGHSFYLGDKFALIPEVAFQAAYYDQEAYDQKSATGAPAGAVEAYDAWSYISTLGLNLAYLEEIDISDQELAVLPEIRAKWFHEFNDELDDYTYVISGAANDFAVRPRDEDLLNLGIGLEMWQWDREHSKLQLDYDFVIGDSYQAHTFSLKISREF